MQTRRNHQGRFSGVGAVKVPETAVRPQKRAEGLSGSAPNGCYGKSDSLAGTKKALRGFFCNAYEETTAA